MCGVGKEAALFRDEEWGMRDEELFPLSILNSPFPIPKKSPAPSNSERDTLRFDMLLI